jgi:hypothetical protein
MEEKVRVVQVEGEYAALWSLREQAVGFRFWAMADKRLGIRSKFLDESEQAALEVKAYLNGEYAGTFRKEGDYVTVLLEDVGMVRGRNEVRLEFEGGIGQFALMEMSIL